MSIAKCIVLALSVVASVNALTTPHAARHSVHHRAIAARASVEPRSANVAPLANLAARQSPGKGRRRCRNRPSDAAAATSAPPVNAAPIPSSTSSSVEEPTSSSTPPPKPSSTPPPKPSSTQAPPPPPPSTTPKPPPASTKAPAPAPSSGGGGGGAPDGFLAGINTGEATYYDAGLGACGIVNGPDDNIVAVSKLLFDNYPGYARTNPNNNPVCGKKIKAMRGDKELIVTVTDRCEACKITDLDFTNGGFDRITGNQRDLGRTQFTWQWL